MIPGKAVPGLYSFGDICRSSVPLTGMQCTVGALAPEVKLPCCQPHPIGLVSAGLAGPDRNAGQPLEIPERATDSNG
jgi:hypothetical protein